MKNLIIYLKTLRNRYERHLTVINIIFIFRYFSFIMTIILYYIADPQKNQTMKIMITYALIIAYSTMTLLYYYNCDVKKHILILGIVETIENSIFLIISGGFSSPFIWYFISNIFVTACKLSNVIAIIYAVIYFLVASITTIITLEPGNNYDIIRLYLNTAISYIIIVIVILQLIKYSIKLEEKKASLSDANKELEETRIKIIDTLKYSLELYETVNIFNLHNNDNIMQKLVEHMKYLTDESQIIFIRLPYKEKQDSIIFEGLSDMEAYDIVNHIIRIKDLENDKSLFRTYKYNKKVLTVYYVMYEQNPCGAFISVSEINSLDQQDILGDGSYDRIDSTVDGLEQNSIITLFLQIVAIVVKKLEFDEIEEQLLISEEQNRIANEIHDIVLQKLFAISCRLYVMSKSDNKFTKKDIKNELMVIKQSIDLTMKDLREAIYGLSWEKQGIDTFKDRLIRYTEEMKHLYDVEISTAINGDTQKIHAYQKHGLFRVVCEAMNNAVRHGCAKHVKIQITIEELHTKIHITDDGKGFDYNEIKQKEEKGLGLNNIYRIIEMLEGHIEINTQVLMGTEVYITIPAKSAA